MMIIRRWCCCPLTPPGRGGKPSRRERGQRSCKLQSSQCSPKNQHYHHRRHFHHQLLPYQHPQDHVHYLHLGHHSHCHPHCQQCWLNINIIRGIGIKHQTSGYLPSLTSSLYSSESPIIKGLTSLFLWWHFDCIFVYLFYHSETAFQRNFLYLTGTKSPKPMVDSVMKQKYMPVMFNLENVFAYLWNFVYFK